MKSTSDNSISAITSYCKTAAKRDLCKNPPITPFKGGYCRGVIADCINLLLQGFCRLLQKG